jgi:ABC-type bacteriocin/lantibiotic exporter with double-glycine peptidase domain
MNKKDVAELKILFHLTKKHWRKFLHVFIWISMVALLRLPMPLFTKFIIDEGLKKNLNLIHMLALGYLGFLLINYVANIAKNYASILLKERAIFMSTHNVFRAKAIADRVGIMKDGQLVAIKTKDELKGANLEKVYIEYMEK